MDKINTLRDNRENLTRKDTLRKDIGKPEKEIFLNGEPIGYSSKGLKVNSNKEGITVSQLEESNHLDIAIKGNVYKVINEKDYMEVHGSNMHFWMKEIDGGMREVTAFYDDPQGQVHRETIKMGADNRKATVGNLTLQHQDNGVLEIKIEYLREEEKITFEGYGKDRNTKYELGDFKMNISSVNNSIKETSKENKETIKKALKKKYPSPLLQGAINGLVDIIPEIHGVVAA